jgi:hypothetical protein
VNDSCYQYDEFSNKVYDKCLVHKNFHIKLRSERYCECDKNNKIIQDYDFNYFTHFINANDIINGMM